jgi:hypothetical protein
MEAPSLRENKGYKPCSPCFREAKGHGKAFLEKLPHVHEGGLPLQGLKKSQNLVFSNIYELKYKK